MGTLFKTFVSWIKACSQKFQALSLFKKIIIIAIIIALGFLLNSLNTKKEDTVEEVKKDRGVRVASVALLSENLSPISLLGTVTSRSEATIRAEGGGKLVAVYKKLGDYVQAGGVIAQFENSAERASVLQAEGAFDAANAGQDIAQTGSDIANINNASADVSLEGAKTQSRNTITAAYSTLDDAIRTKTDSAFRNPQTREAHLIVTVADAKLIIKIDEERIAIESMLRAREERNRTLDAQNDLLGELSKIEDEARMVRDYLDDLSFAYSRSIVDNNASQAAIDGFKANTGIARSAVSGALTSIAQSRNALNASISANEIAEKNVIQGNTQSIVSGAAQIKSAQGNLDAAKARLEKTIMRSPISGTINSITIETGDFVAPFTEVAVVSNNSALELVASVTDEEARQLTVGDKVTIEGGAQGVITKVAPALDPKTKKIEVRIGILGSTTALINGQSVQVSALRTKIPAAKNIEEMRVPLSALKITPTGVIVFSVTSSSTLLGHVVKEGALLGDQIVIISGVTPDMEIVTDARGLEEGVHVTTTK
jgi:multidrug efflux pump subunit AcrA (membrane-fusion protein)